MTNRVWNGGLIILAITIAVAQPGAAQSMAKPMAMAKTYTGCVSAGATAGTFTLTHAAEEMAMPKDGMTNDAMKKDAMSKDMAAKTFAIVSSSVDLKGHVGHQVALTATEAPAAMGMDTHDGMSKSADGMAKPMDQMAKPAAMTHPAASLAVTALRMIATTCTM